MSCFYYELPKLNRLVYFVKSKLRTLKRVLTTSDEYQTNVTDILNTQVLVYGFSYQKNMGTIMNNSERCANHDVSALDTT